MNSFIEYKVVFLFLILINSLLHEFFTLNLLYSCRNARAFSIRRISLSDLTLYCIILPKEVMVALEYMAQRKKLEQFSILKRSYNKH